ncbi:MAG: glycosyltransferase family 39 protein [bacterium]|nr:glycosyltransferase family 39 protein [bacterium]
MYIFLITLLGFVLRITNIVKPEGLWNDEYVSWLVASTPFRDGFFQEIIKQCHMPLYYLYLKPFYLCSDTILRLSSVVPSVLAIPVMYLVGKEYSERCAKYSALITSILPFLVYYSQEVRLYSLVFLLSSITLLFLIRSIKNMTKKNITLYIISSIILIFTHVLGIIFIFLTTVYLAYKKKLASKKLLLALLIISLTVLPFGLNILRQSPSSQWWGIFSYTNIMFLFSDFFSPILTNHINAPLTFFYKKEAIFTFLITIPTLIGLIGIISGFKKIKELLLISFIFIFILSVFAMTGKFVFITKYSIEILPILILSVSIGFDDNNKIKTVLFYTFIIINLLAIYTPYYPAKITRIEGNKLPAVILNKLNPNNIVFTYYSPDRFKRYLKTNSKLMHISKINRFDYKEHPEKIFDKTNKNESVAIVFLDSVSFIPQNMIYEAQIKIIPEMFITFSSIRNSLENYIKNNFKTYKTYKTGSWTILYTNNANILP